MSNQDEDRVFDVLPAGAPAGSARVIRFHTFFDSEYLLEDQPTRFYVNGYEFAKDVGFRKVFGHDTNVQVNGGMGAGRVKWAQRASLLVEDAEDEDEFELEAVFCQSIVQKAKLRTGTANAVQLSSKNPLNQEEKPFIKILDLEQFYFSIRGPDYLAGKFARLTLHGPLAVASSA